MHRREFWHERAKSMFNVARQISSDGYRTGATYIPKSIKFEDSGPTEVIQCTYPSEIR